MRPTRCRPSPSRDTDVAQWAHDDARSARLAPAPADDGLETSGSYIFSNPSLKLSTKKGARRSPLSPEPGFEVRLVCLSPGSVLGRVVVKIGSGKTGKARTESAERFVGVVEEK